LQVATSVDDEIGSVVNNAFTAVVLVGVLVLAFLLWRQRSSAVHD
jgi:multidrug efflux pump subunit AcrB